LGGRRLIGLWVTKSISPRVTAITSGIEAWALFAALGETCWYPCKWLSHPQLWRSKLAALAADYAIDHGVHISPIRTSKLVMALGPPLSNPADAKNPGITFAHYDVFLLSTRSFSLLQGAHSDPPEKPGAEARHSAPSLKRGQV
jgi:hypothetical protein